MKAYSLFLQTVVALALCAIVAKLYFPAADAIGVHIGAPNQGDMEAVKQLDATSRPNAVAQLRKRIPLTRVQGDVEVSGSVSIEGPVEIEH